ncbi:hypothetical protein PV328_010918 [Microctonus aethiopoides]|uniref:Uncharacterized protein n=1 Tax=Microctonus aethiopoides TaxID=144406 RepID=A0AA39FJ19_9HYME|nr:hypothetical protein PV328_010918 [Microctonus aethiopoides]
MDNGEQVSAISSFDSDEKFIGPWIYHSRSRRDTNLNLNLIKDSYERAVNESIADYYAQRKAVMDRYYARQREISEKFLKNVSTSMRPLKADADNSLLKNNVTNILEDEIGKSSNISMIEKRDESPRITRHEHGYESQGECEHDRNDQLVYQHNLGIGLKGPSQLDATLKVNLDGLISITCVEALPYDNTTGILTWLAGGPGTDFVEINLRALENKGVSYTIKVWGIKSSECNKHNQL